MISIILLIYFARSIGVEAESLGQKPWKWKIRAIIAWILGDLAGGFIILYFFGFNIVLLALFSTGMGYLGFLLVKQWLYSLEEDSEYEEND